jgi:NAD(P)-dependent dehydrogenase (short-subunit alcohol dehydrogenase family)
MKTVLITGCSSGFGRATASLFLERGWNVVATMRAPEKSDLRASTRLRVLRMDVTVRGSIDDGIREGMEAFDGLDVVVNNAGIGLMAALEATSEKLIHELFETNTFGAIAVSQAVVPHFRERRGGVLVNVTSSAAIVPMPLVSIYNATKCAIDGFTESLAYELSLFGVRAKIVQPGFSPHTSFIANSTDRMSGLVSEPYAPYTAQLTSGMDGAKTTTGADVANAVWLAATDESKRLRYPAGPDAEEMAALRRAHPGDDYLELMRAAVGPK